MNQKSSVLKTAAIDVGHWYTKYTTGWINSGANKGLTIHAELFPSITSGPPPIIKIAGSPALDGVNITLVGKGTYFVGKDAEKQLGSAGFLRMPSSEYSATANYKALFLGALWHIARHHRVTRSMVIETLVVGLPFTTLFTHAEPLEKMCTGTHVVPSPIDQNTTITIDVKRVLVLGQPQGCILNMKEVIDAQCPNHDDNVLIVDMGGGTLDWYVSNAGLQPDFKKSGAAHIGTLSCAASIVEQIDDGHKANPQIMNRVDFALRTGNPTFMIGRQTLEINKYWPQAYRLLTGALEQMRATTGKLTNYMSIVLTGGGANVLARSIKEFAPEVSDRIIMDPDTVFSNVKGFHQFGENF